MKVTIQYLAGLFDGEGCISITCAKQGWKNSRSKSPAYELKLHIRMTDPRPIKIFSEFFKDTIGGFIVRQENYEPQHKPTYCFSCSHTKAKKIIEQLLPYLIVKKEQANVALNFQKYIEESRCQGKIGFNRRPVPAYILNRRHHFYLAMRKLKSLRLHV